MWRSERDGRWFQRVGGRFPRAILDCYPSFGRRLDGQAAVGSRNRSTQKSALELLQEQRYANGEIDREEFLQKRKDLSG